MFFFGLFVFVSSNQYFGWNKEAQSGSEELFDIIWHIFLLGGGIMWLIQGEIKDSFLQNMDISIIKKYNEKEKK